MSLRKRVQELEAVLHKMKKQECPLCKLDVPMADPNLHACVGGNIPCQASVIIREVLPGTQGAPAQVQRTHLWDLISKRRKKRFA